MEEVDDSDSDTPFVSKVGGKPAWTDLKTLPPEHTCKKCGKPTVLLVQFHAPHTSCVEDLGEEATEDPRTLFLFMCKDPHCHSPGDASPFHVLRYESGGSKFGSTYPHSASPGAARSHDMPSNSETGEVEKEEEEKDTHPSLCVVCGGRGTKSCGGCRKVNYCSRYHQIHDWKSGHQKSCSNPTQTPPTLTYDPSSGVVLPEWDVVTEPEPRGRGKGEERSEAERMRDYEAYVKENSVRGGGGAWSAEGLEELVGKRGGKGKEEDKVFKAFMKKVAIEKQQVRNIHFIGSIKSRVTSIFRDGTPVFRFLGTRSCACAHFGGNFEWGIALRCTRSTEPAFQV